ncbi:MAG TPA: PEGA domain-containing protein [Thermoanaerobaculia bacterium]|nr:PEGA domain-containing protein [Thermoanaerobaculia bacterium]
MTLRRATEQLREVGSLPLLLAVLLIAASGDLSAQDRSRSRSNDSSDHGSRTAVPRSEGAPRASAPSSPSSPPRSASPSSPSSDSGSASSSSPSRRRAVPGSPGESHRQPPSRDRYDSSRHGRGGDWYYRNYYPRWHSYYGPGWWWAPYGYWGWWLGDNYWPYDPYYYGDPYYRDRGRRSYGRDDVGALDLDISPGRTQVYLDGQYIGTVDQYDGFPTYLWLDKGTYDIVFYLDGYKTLARQVSIYPGAVIDMDDRLEPGESVRPEDLVTKTHERRDDRLRYERERRERIDRGGDPHGEDDQGWRDRVSRDREDRRDRGEEIEIEHQGGRTEQGRLRLEVEPDDASIYLDGKFVGTAQDLASLRRGLLVEPGKHTVAVVRPGRESVERDFEVDAGEDVDLEIELETADR